MTTTTQDSLDAMNIDYYTFNVGFPYIGALMNDDWSELSSEDSKYLFEFCEGLKRSLLEDKKPLTGHWTINYSFNEQENEQELTGNYTRCDITGLGNSTYTLFWVIVEG